MKPKPNPKNAYNVIIKNTKLALFSLFKELIEIPCISVNIIF